MSGISTFLPSYDTSSEYNAEILRKSVPLMVKHKVSTHPINYAIWYEYVAGINSKLIDAIDGLIENKTQFDEETSLELYKNYICNASIESFEKINSDLQKLVSNAAVTVQDASSKVSDAGESFITSSQQLESVAELTDVKTVLSGIVDETKQLADVSQTLKSKLDEANDELATLRSELTKVKEMATTDALTGLLNRRAFDSELSELVSNTLGSDHSLAIIDLDHFKKVNDTFGHLVGDKVIRYTAGLLKKHAAEQHHIARYGGEEMAIIMPNTDLKSALEISEKIRGSLEKSQLKQKDNDISIGKITASFGVTCLTMEDDVESFIARADKALYAAKENGRNKVEYL